MAFFYGWGTASRTPLRPRSGAEWGSHWPLGDRQARLPGGERANLHAKREYPCARRRQEASFFMSGAQPRESPSPLRHGTDYHRQSVTTVSPLCYPKRHSDTQTPLTLCRKQQKNRPACRAQSAHGRVVLYIPEGMKPLCLESAKDERSPGEYPRNRLRRGGSLGLFLSRGFLSETRNPDKKSL